MDDQEFEDLAEIVVSITMIAIILLVIKMGWIL